MEKRDQLSTTPVRNELAAANQGADPAGGEAEDACGFVQIHELSHGHLLWLALLLRDLAEGRRWSSTGVGPVSAAPSEGVSVCAAVVHAGIADVARTTVGEVVSLAPA